MLTLSFSFFFLLLSNNNTQKRERKSNEGVAIFQVTEFLSNSLIRQSQLV